MREKSKLNNYMIYYKTSIGEIKKLFVRGRNKKNAISNALIYKIGLDDIETIIVKKVEEDEKEN